MMALMLTMVGDEEQNDWDMQLPHVERAPIATPSAPPPGLPPTKYFQVHTGRLPRLPLTAFEITNNSGHQRLNRD